MTTRAIVPNGDGEGSLGTSTAKWGAVYSSDPASGENSGQVPTTAWVQTLVAQAVAAAQKQAKLDAHPVGSYYFSDKSTSPADLFGGTWEALPAGYTLIAQGSGTDDYGSYTYTAGQKYGERKHQLTTDEMPSHSHAIDRANTGNAQREYIPYSADTSIQAGRPEAIHSTGGDKPHNNIQPSICAYGWVRIA